MKKIKAGWKWCVDKVKDVHYKIKAHYKYKKKMKEIKKRDPFVYK